MIKITKLICLSLVLVMLLSAFVSCGGEISNTDVPQPDAETETESEKEEVLVEKYTEIQYVPYKALGRTQLMFGQLAADWTAAGIAFEATCKGEVSINMTVNGTRKFTVVVDGTEYKDVVMESGDNVIATGLEYGKHSFSIMNQEGYSTAIDINGVTLCGTYEAAPRDSELMIEYIGDSVAHGGDGLLNYAYLSAKALGADYTIMANSGMGLKWGTDHDGANVNRSMKKYPYLNDKERGTILYTGYTRAADLVVIGLNTNDNYRFSVQYKENREAFKASHPGFTWPEVDADSQAFTATKMQELGAELDLLIAEIEKHHGKDVPIILARGMMETDDELYLTSVNYLTKLIEEEWQGKYGNHTIKVARLTSDRSGYANHPSQAGAAVQGAELAEFIRREFPELVPTGK